MEPRIQDLVSPIRQCAYDLHAYLRHGHLEKVYENGLMNRLNKIGLKVHQQHPIPVHDEDGTLLGDFFADLLVQDQIIVELKAAKHIADEHIAQTLGYLRASGLSHGILINFGAPVFQIKKLIL